MGQGTAHRFDRRAACRIRLNVTTQKSALIRTIGACDGRREGRSAANAERRFSMSITTSMGTWSARRAMRAGHCSVRDCFAV